jgi:hypothetical protein
MNDQTFDFTPEEWRTLLKTPVLVFLFVAAVDGRVQADEVAAFQRVLAAAGGYKSALLARILSDVEPQFSMVLSQVLVGGVDAGRSLRQARTLVEARLPEEEALLFKQSLFYVGNQIARATGSDGALRDEKAEALMTLARVFGLVPEE